jgi:hypothetical protein
MRQSVLRRLAAAGAATAVCAGVLALAVGGSLPAHAAATAAATKPYVAHRNVILFFDM